MTASINKNSAFQISVFPGDGIGQEVIDPTVALLQVLERDVGGFSFTFAPEQAGARHYQETGTALPEDAMKRAQDADAILLGAMGLPDIRQADGREIAPQLDLRENLELFAGVRPVKTRPGAPNPLSDPRAQALDFVLIRESTEGLFAGRGQTRYDGPPDRPTAAHDTQTLTRAGCERLFDFAFDLAAKRKQRGHRGQLLCVDKANVLGGFYWMRQIFDEVAERHDGVEPGHMYVDACALNMVRRPWEFDVLVTENMFGDILSDLGAGLMGGMGMAPSADIGARHAVFQPCHGSAPDIMGQGLANPTATILSAALMLDWLGDAHGITACNTAADLLESAVDIAFESGDLVPTEFGGSANTKAVTDAVLAPLMDGRARRRLDAAA